MTSPSPSEQFEAWCRHQNPDIDRIDVCRKAWLAAYTAAQQAQREADMAVVVKVLTDEIPGVDSLLERVLDALWRRDDEPAGPDHQERGR